MLVFKSVALIGGVSLGLLAGCGKKEDAAPGVVGRWEEVGQTLTTYNSQNQVESSRASNLYNGQVLTLRADGTFEHLVRYTGTVTGTYVYAGGRITATWPAGGGTSRSSMSEVLEVSATDLRLQHEGLGSSTTRVLVETRYVRK